MNPTCFISYSWDSDPHKLWVRSLAERLQINGVTTYLDQWDIKLGTDVTHYMETSIREAGFVLLICTPNFAAKANWGKGGVGYEKQIATGEIFANLAAETKFIPVLRAGEPHSALPSYLLAKVFIDFRKDELFETSFKLLLRNLYDAPESVRPALGSKPEFLATTPETSNASTTHESELDLKRFDLLFKFAYGTGGLNLTREAAVKWAQDKVELGDRFDLNRYQQLFKYAYGPSGLNLDRDTAVTWADDKIKWGTAFDLDRFNKLFQYAYGSSGLNLMRDQAVAWAEQNIRKN